MRYIIENGNIYIIKYNKIVGVNISSKEIKEVGSEKALPKEYTSYSEDEIKRKFQINSQKPYVFKKEEEPKEKLGGKTKGKGNSK